MSRGAVALALAAALLWLAGAVGAACCNGDTETLNGCSNAGSDCASAGASGSASDCECSQQNCNVCPGYNRCCQSCCENSCNCRSFSCNSCSSGSSGSSDGCCNSCCRCSSRTRRCYSACSQCSCDSCGSTPNKQSSCCNNCCQNGSGSINITTERIIQPSTTNVTHITTLPNITIIINHAPIYVNNTPVINTEQHCGSNNASLINNGTHVVYIYPQNSTCANRTCCSRRVHVPCKRMPPPFPPVCPPPVVVPDCRPRCHYLPPPTPPPPPLCNYYQSWPYVHCPLSGCFGFGCVPPPAAAPPQPMPMMQQSGCMSVPSWPFMRCGPGLGGLGGLAGLAGGYATVGSPSYQVLGPGAESGPIPFSATDHEAVYAALPPGALATGYPPAAPGPGYSPFGPFPAGPPGY